METEFVRVEKEGVVAHVILARPERRNALSLAALAEIEEVARSFREDLDTRVVVFRAEGPHFSAGADLKDPDRVPPRPALAALRQHQSGPRMLRAVLEMEPLTVAALHGVTAGGAACLASACDFRIGAEDCRVRYPEVALAMPLAWAALPLVVHLVGPARAKRMVILGQDVPARTLLEWGFVESLVPEAGLADAARALAQELAAMPPLAAQMVKRSVNALVGALDQAVMHMDLDQLVLAHGSDDFREAIRAFREGRPPRFTGA